MDTNLTVTIIVAIIGSSAVWEFIHFLIDRNDKKKEKKDNCSKQILDAIEKLNAKIDRVDKELSESRAIAARIRILKFMDELLEPRKHTKDSYDQVMSDITSYEKYCKEHPTFKNNQTAATVQYITKDYQKRLEKHDFL